jgi:hypothetical protein
MPEHVLKRGVGKGIGEALGSDPRLVADRPAVPVAVDVAVAQKLLGDAMTRRGAGSSQIVAAADEITQSFLLRRGRLHDTSSPARYKRTGFFASRRSVLTRSPARIGINDGAITSHATPILDCSR